MSFVTELVALVRGTTSTPVHVSANSAGEPYTVKRIPDFVELVVGKKVWKVQDLTTTVVLNDVLPTTASALTVQNPTEDIYYVVMGVSAILDVAPASLGAVSFSHAAHKAKVTAYTRDLAHSTIGGYYPGQGAYSGEIVLDRGATVVDDGWTPIGKMVVNAVASQTFMSDYFKLDIPVVIPPGYHWSLGATGNDATFEAGMGLVWAELTLSELR